MKVVAAMKPALFISFDLETLGGAPEDETIINMGFVACTEDRTEIGSLDINVEAKKGDPKTIEWFNSTPELKASYEKCTRNPLPREEAMKEVRDWIGGVSKGYRPVLVAYPTIFDGSLLYAYWFKYLGHPTNGRGVGFQIIDIRSYGAGRLNIDYELSSKEKGLADYVAPKDKFPHTHCGLDDARAQMELFFNLRDLTKTRN